MPGTNSRGERPAWEGHEAPFRAKDLPKTTILGSPQKRSVSLGGSSANSNLQFRRFSPSSQIWIGGLPGCQNLAKDIQPHLSHNKDLQLAGTYSQRYLLESCRSLEELEIQVRALFSHLRLRERDGYLSRLNTHVPTATRKDLRVSPLVGEYIFDEELVSQAGNRLQGDVSLKSNTIMLDTLAKGQGQKARPLLSLSDPLQPYPSGL